MPVTSWLLLDPPISPQSGPVYCSQVALLETNPYLLALTIIVSIVHSVFEFLAFKNGELGTQSGADVALNTSHVTSSCLRRQFEGRKLENARFLALSSPRGDI